jgi:hypothetical protein
MAEHITYQRIIHQGQARIQLNFPYRTDWIAKVKSIAGRKWSQSRKCWHIPDTKESLEQLKQLFPHLQEQSSPSSEAIAPPATPAKEETFTHSLADKPVYMSILSAKLLLTLAKQQKDIAFIRGLRYARWNSMAYRWEITNTPANLQAIRAYFGSRLEQAVPDEQVRDHKEQKIKADYHQVLIQPTREGRLRLIFAYHKPLIAFIKQLPYPVYDAANRWWSVADTERVRSDLTTYLQAQGWQWQYLDEKASSGKPRPRAISAHYRQVPTAYTDMLSSKRYSANTVRTYTDLFAEFINYYYSDDPKEINEKQIIAYLRYLVDERQVSISYQNQAINAIKHSMPDSTMNRY